MQNLRTFFSGGGMEIECLALKDLTSPQKTAPTDFDGTACGNEHKENICTEKKRCSPLTASSSVPSLLLARKSPASDHTPIKHADLSGPFADPWTPTANLKMLISVASPEIRDREMKKVLFRPIENEMETQVVADPLEDTEFDTVEEEDGEKKPSRKEKSLGLLCQKFLSLYPNYPPTNKNIKISLDVVATNLCVERRRIYDIVNVLESLAIVRRNAKNCYTWFGRQWLDATLAGLQRQGREQGYHLLVEQAAGSTEDRPSREGVGLGLGCAVGDPAASINRKDKSLRIMSQKFVMLFLVSKTKTVTLDAAARVLIDDSQDSPSDSKYKTKVRRLYDIANVLTSLDLIKKFHVQEERGKKPAFQWLGPTNFNSPAEHINQSETHVVRQPMAVQSNKKPSQACHASAAKNQVNSAPSTPGRVPTGNKTSVNQQPVDFSVKTYTSSGSSSAPPTPSPGSSLQPSAFGQLIPQALPCHHPDPDPGPGCPKHTPHCLAYLPSLAQPSVVLLYSPLGAHTGTCGGQGSPGPTSGQMGRRKRSGGEMEEEGELVIDELSQVEQPDRKMKLELETHQFQTPPTEGPARDRSPFRVSVDREVENNRDLQPAHYLYVPNNAGLSSLNLLLSTGQPTEGVPTLALPYVLVPSYPLIAGSFPGSTAVMSPAHFLLGGGSYSLAVPQEANGSSIPSPSTPERGTPFAASLSPSARQQTVGTPESLAPHTPKETAEPGSNAFFQTPGALGVSSTPAVARKRGSAQRRLDVGHPQRRLDVGHPPAS